MNEEKFVSGVLDWYKTGIAKQVEKAAFEIANSLKENCYGRRKINVSIEFHPEMCPDVDILSEGMITCSASVETEIPALGDSVNMTYSGRRSDV